MKGKIEKPSHAGASKDIADCLAAVVHHVEEGWRQGQGAQGMFQIGIVERPGQITESSHLMQQAVPQVARGAPLMDAAREKLVFGELDKL